MPSVLDSDPDNQLGEGIFAPTFEAELLAQGCVFARRLPPRQGKPFWSLVASYRPIADAVTDGELDNPFAARCLSPVPTP